jgi:hypothetical protein
MLQVLRVMVKTNTHYIPITLMKQGTISVLVEGSERQYDGTIDVPKRYVRIVKDEELKQHLENRKLHLLERKYGVIDENQRQQFIFFLRLTNALNRDNLSGIYKSLELQLDSTFPINNAEDAEAHFEQEQTWIYHIKKNPREVLSSLMNAWLNKIHLVGWWPKNDDSLHVGFYCDNITSAFFALWFSRLNHARGFDLCSWCNQPFERGRKGQKFCSERCQQNNAVARHRRKAKEAE